MNLTARRILGGAAVSAVIAGLVTPVALAEDAPPPPPLINVPNEWFPYIGVAPWLHDIIVNFMPGINTGVEGINNQYQEPIQDISGGAGNVFCVISGFFGSPCKPIPLPPAQ